MTAEMQNTSLYNGLPLDDDCLALPLMMPCNAKWSPSFVLSQMDHCWRNRRDTEYDAEGRVKHIASMCQEPIVNFATGLCGDHTKEMRNW